jgi:hypothetical protein
MLTILCYLLSYHPCYSIDHDVDHYVAHRSTHILSFHHLVPSLLQTSLTIARATKPAAIPGTANISTLTYPHIRPAFYGKIIKLTN